MRDDVLDPARAAAAGAAFGQLACALPAGGLLISTSRLVELGVRATVLLAPGLFRLDVRPSEDTLQVMTRSLRDGARWGTSPEAATDYGRKADETPEPARADFTFFAQVDEQAVLARVMLLSTIDRERGFTHFVAHAILREVDPSMVRLRARG